jgi:hypothetical protein
LGNLVTARSAVTSVPYRFVNPSSGIGTGQTAHVRLPETSSMNPRVGATASSLASASAGRRSPTSASRALRTPALEGLA